MKNLIIKRLESRKGLQGSKGTFSVSARIRKHYCPTCAELVDVIRKEQIVNSGSVEAKDFDFRDNNLEMSGRIYGNVRFTWDVFYCRACDLEMPVIDVIKHNRAKKRRIKQERKNKC